MVRNEVKVNGEEKAKNEQNAEKKMKTTAKKNQMKSASEAMLNVYDAKEGDTIEICPEACMLMQDVVQWLEATTGERKERK